MMGTHCTCKSCGWFTGDVQPSERAMGFHGHCHASTPRMFIANDGLGNTSISGFPLVRKDDFCGAYRDRPADSNGIPLDIPPIPQ